MIREECGIDDILPEFRCLLLLSPLGKVGDAALNSPNLTAGDEILAVVGVDSGGRTLAELLPGVITSDTPSEYRKGAASPVKDALVWPLL